MTVNRGPGVAPIAGVGTTTVEHRLQLAGLYAENAPGVPRSGVLAQATDQLVVSKSDWSYDVGPASLVIGRTAGEGVYTPTLTGTTNVSTDAAPATDSRWDLIYIKQNDQAKGDVDNMAIVGVQKGVAAASPNKPTADLPAGAYVIAEARIFAGTTGTSGGSNTVAQVWRHTAARGARIAIRNLTERSEITTPVKGQEVIRTDRNNHVQAWDGTAWKWISRPERYYADPTTFVTTSNQLSKLIGTVTAQPTRTYATKMRANGRLTVFCDAYASGVVRIKVGVSVAQTQAVNAQSKANVSWLAPGGYYQNAGAETDWIPVVASDSGAPRIWIEHVAGGVNEQATAVASDGHLWVEVLPADD